MELQTPGHLGPSSLSHPLDGKAAGREGTPGLCHLSFEVSKLQDVLIGSLNPNELPRRPRVTGQVVSANLEGTRSAAVLAWWQDLGARSSVVHFERELDFTLVILTVAYRSDFSEVSRVEEIECPRGSYYAVTRKPRE